jgi:hypothetical protein
MLNEIIGEPCREACVQVLLGAKWPDERSYMSRPKDFDAVGVSIGEWYELFRVAVLPRCISTNSPTRARKFLVQWRSRKRGVISFDLAYNVSYRPV